jgi:hypothetical protein
MPVDYIFAEVAANPRIWSFVHAGAAINSRLR